jgi:hypothetical protein
VKSLVTVRTERKRITHPYALNTFFNLSKVLTCHRKLSQLYSHMRHNLLSLPLRLSVTRLNSALPPPPHTTPIRHCHFPSLIPHPSTTPIHLTPNSPTYPVSSYLSLVHSSQWCGSAMFIPDPWSRIRLFVIPDPNCFHPGSRIRIKKFKYFNPKKWGLNSGNMIRVVHPGSGSWLFIHPVSRIQGSKRHRIPDPDPQPCLLHPFISRLSLSSTSYTPPPPRPNKVRRSLVSHTV